MLVEVKRSRSVVRLNALRDYHIAVADLAEQQLVDIAQWYADRNPAGVDHFVEALERFRANLTKNPRMGRARPELLERLRSWPIHPWIVYYSISEHERRVDIEAVYHGAMDIDSDDFSEEDADEDS
ncbi:MAG: type II toxin-antitoxin system RelE/ParE family toxin [Candidatus Eremiobacteraeota bacterium]|nr:type II toxin-antitoxin system RelE/ParE family toxin [Candidatus Eremiobacteraeota bacterium]